MNRFLFIALAVLLSCSFVLAETPMTQPVVCEACKVTARRGSASPTTAPTAIAPADRQGMASISAGTFWMGSDDPQFPDAAPRHQVRLDAFWIDKTTVTNEQFAAFIAATGYVTVAEKPLDPKQFPGVPAEQLVPGSVVFTAPDGPVDLRNPANWWRVIAGADWRHPEGPSSSIKGRETHPVVQVAYSDAATYAAWAGKRLPTEAEFEYAARGGLDRKVYAWGDEFKPDGRFQANTFQGHFPDHNTAEDGFAGTAPVGSFPANGYGLSDMAGNVWQWCSDWYRPNTYAAEAANGAIVVNPTGPADSLDPDEPGIKKRVQRGGSFLCTDQYCTRYIVGSRGKGDVDTGTNHIGFRCVASPTTAPATR